MHEKREVLICVHGTGAADASDDGSQWWQRGSPFNSILARAIAPAVTVESPFHWSGANSQRERLSAAADLWLRLRALDEQGIGYHLIGHSHGGSVIWGALSHGSLKGRLPGLRSWTTVGTPFLEYSRSPFDLITSTGFVLVAGLTASMVMLVWPYVSRDGGAWMDRWEWLVPSTLLLLMTVLALVLMRSVVQPAKAGILWRHTTEAERRSAGHRLTWLGLWHKDDESISGLASTLRTPDSLTPRLGRGVARHPVLRAPMVAYDRFVARAIDQFVWRQLARKAHGNDISGSMLVGVRRSPAAFDACWPELPAEIVSRITERCDLEAGKSLGAVRKILGVACEAGNAGAALSQLRSSLTWKELIHTSYFDEPGVVSLIAAHVLRHSDTNQATGAAILDRTSELAVASGLDQWLSIGLSCEMVQSSKMAAWMRDAELRYLTTIGAVGLAVVLAVAIWGSFQALVAPYTDKFQIDTIEAVAPREEVSATDFEVAAEYNAALVAIGSLKRAEDFIHTIDHPAAKGDALLRMVTIRPGADETRQIGWLEAARGHARELGTGTERTSLLSDIGASYVALGRIDLAGDVLNEAAVTSIYSHWRNALDVAVTLDQIAASPAVSSKIKQHVLGEARNYPSVFLDAVAKNIGIAQAMDLVASTSANGRGGLFGTLARIAVDVGKENAILVSIRQIREPSVRRVALGEATHAFLGADRRELAAITLAEMSQIPADGPDAMRRSADLAASMMDLAGAAGTQEGFAKIDGEDNREVRDLALETIVRAFIAAGRLEDASHAVVRLETPGARPNRLQDLAAAIAKSLDESAARLTLKYADPPATTYLSFLQHREVMANLLLAIAAKGDVVSATNIVVESLRTQNDAGPVDVLLEVSRRLASLGFATTARYLLNEASKLIASVTVDTFRSQLRFSSARVLANLGEYRLARLEADKCATTDRLRAHTAILLAYGSAGDRMAESQREAKGMSWDFVVEYD